MCKVRQKATKKKEIREFYFPQKKRSVINHAPTGCCHISWHDLSRSTRNLPYR